MKNPKLKALLLALSLGAVASAGAQTYGPTTPGTADTATPQPLLTSPSLARPEASGGQDSSANVMVPSTADSTVILLAPAAPATPDGLPSGIDPKADSKCRNAAVNSYWECVNSHNGD